MNEDFTFMLKGTTDVVTYKDLEDRWGLLAKHAIEESDAQLKRYFQHELDSIERRLVEIYDRKLDSTNEKGSIGRMRLHDVLLKFR